MKLAEALLLRADLQKRFSSLRERVIQNTVVQEGETPSEDPKGLLAEVAKTAAKLEELISAVNTANCEMTTSSGRSIAAALVERDVLILRHGVVQAAASSVVKPPERYGNKEIRWVKTVDPAVLQKEADELAQSIRRVNAEIQSSNWAVDINANEE